MNGTTVGSMRRTGAWPVAAGVLLVLVLASCAPALGGVPDGSQSGTDGTVTVLFGGEDRVLTGIVADRDNISAVDIKVFDSTGAPVLVDGTPVTGTLTYDSGTANYRGSVALGANTGTFTFVGLAMDKTTTTQVRYLGNGTITFPASTSVTIMTGTTGDTGTVLGMRGPAGGIIFKAAAAYTTSGTLTWRFMEAWTADESGTYLWKTSSTSTAGTSTAVGTGYDNTHTAMAGTAHPAAELARNANHNDFTDWFLPSKDEVNLMYGQKAAIGGFADAGYWSSSDYGSNLYAWINYFAAGLQMSEMKFSYAHVRVARAF